MPSPQLALLKGWRSVALISVALQHAFRVLLEIDVEVHFAGLALDVAVPQTGRRLRRLRVGSGSNDRKAEHNDGEAKTDGWFASKTSRSNWIQCTGAGYSFEDRAQIHLAGGAAKTRRLHRRRAVDGN